MFRAGMDMVDTARAYRRRAEVREIERHRLYEHLRGAAREIAAGFQDRFGPEVRVYLFGSLLDLERFRSGSDMDLAVGGLDPREYWEAWRVAEDLARGRRVDLVRLETASASLREAVHEDGEQLA